MVSGCTRSASFSGRTLRGRSAARRRRRPRRPRGPRGLRRRRERRRARRHRFRRPRRPPRSSRRRLRRRASRAHAWRSRYHWAILPTSVIFGNNCQIVVKLKVCQTLQTFCCRTPVLGCIESAFCKEVFILQHLPRSPRSAHFCSGNFCTGPGFFPSARLGFQLLHRSRLKYFSKLSAKN